MLGPELDAGEQAPSETPEGDSEESPSDQRSAATEPAPDDRSHLVSNLERLRRGAQKIRKWRGSDGSQEATKLIRPGAQATATESKTAARAGAQAAKTATKAAARATARAAAMAARAVASFLVSTFPVWGPIVAVILIIVIIVIFIVSIFNLSGSQGGGLPITPTTAEQKSQATLLAALAGDSIAKNEVVLETVESEKERYQRIQLSADRHSPGLSASVRAKAAEFGQRLDELAAEQDPNVRKGLVKTIQDDMLAFEATLPFGVWIAEIAKSYIGQPNLRFCLITGAPAHLACASFASTVLWEAGVPNVIVPNTTALWHNKALRLIVDRQSSVPPTADTSRLQAGDVVWFGSGVDRYQGALFSHVGIYVGDGMMVDTTSRLNVLSIQHRRVFSGGRNGFNGAKRYGADL